MAQSHQKAVVDAVAEGPAPTAAGGATSSSVSDGAGGDAAESRSAVLIAREWEQEYLNSLPEQARLLRYAGPGRLGAQAGRRSAARSAS